MDGQIRRIELGNGEIVYARVSTAAGSYGAADRDVGVGDRAAARLEQLTELIQRVGGTVLDAASAVKPHEASIAFGVELTAKSGKALAVLAEGEAKASLHVTLTWRLGDGGAAPAGTNG
ncbi:CU044_2847 family protein [Streptomyces ficellus]|uniref:CU044_2847 family protein n=1 Tax=Streptomyces ficellus TaxID=1977088 RepID=A0ABT7ZC49_9ACTN|nr:CU044_2847 family protein [Streptomyces ficellus]MDN3297023.1 CU044_2847 family protein [Streptomyces ficellus]